MEKSLDVDEKMELLLHQLDPKKGVIGQDEIRQILLEENRDLKIYWGTAPTGKPHLGYFVPIYKIGDFLRAGCHVTILFADLHGFLDSMKSSWEVLKARCDWYEMIIKEMLQTIGVPIDKLHFTRGTDFQLSPDYTLDMYRMAAMVTTTHTKHAGAEVVKSNDNPLMSSLLYPMLQALDEEYLGVDVQFGGIDQRKIFAFSREKLPLLGYKKRAYLMNSLIPSLSRSGKLKGGELNKMSASEANSKIDFDDAASSIQEKINAAYSLDGEVTDNGLLAICEFVLWRYLDGKGDPLVVPRPEKWGGPQLFHSYKEMEKAFADKELVSGDLKSAVSTLLVEFLEPLRTFCVRNRDALDRAYPEFAIHQNQTNASKSLGPYSMDIRVGTVVEVSVHPDADRLYVEKIDLGELGVRTVVSGVRNFISEQDFKGSRVLVCCNMASKQIQGIESVGMILCASTKGKDRQLELPRIPLGVSDGEQLHWEGIEPRESDSPVISNSRMKKLFKFFKTDDEGHFVYKDNAARLDRKPITSNLKGAVVG